MAEIKNAVGLSNKTVYSGLKKLWLRKEVIREQGGLKRKGHVYKLRIMPRQEILPKIDISEEAIEYPALHKDKQDRMQQLREK